MIGIPRLLLPLFGLVFTIEVFSSHKCVAEEIVQGPAVACGNICNLGQCSTAPA